MDQGANYFELHLDSLRAIGGWAADCTERVLWVYALHAPADPRPRAALDGIREFAAGGKRAAWLRSLAMAAHAALALELHHKDDPTIADSEVAWAIAHAPPAVRAVLLEMPARAVGKSRVDGLLYALDAGIRGRGLV